MSSQERKCLAKLAAKCINEPLDGLLGSVQTKGSKAKAADGRVWVGVLCANGYDVSRRRLDVVTAGPRLEVRTPQRTAKHRLLRPAWLRGLRFTTRFNLQYWFQRPSS
jgi:hypothetical protein